MIETPTNSPRLQTLLERVRQVLLNQSGQWLSLAMICAAVESTSTASVSARLRDLRKTEFGGYRVEARCLYRGCWQYRVVFA